jgi:hypothetical protein
MAINNIGPNSRVAIIGAGGIGSFFCRHLSRMLSHEQLPFGPKQVTVFDFDAVEKKNLRHQDYMPVDLGVPKSAVMSVRYKFKSKVIAFEEQHCNNYDLFIVCADNPGVRRVVYEHAKTYDKPFVDMRCEGKNIAILTHNASKDFLLSSLGSKPESTEGQSCQLEVDTQNDIIQLGNMVVAPKGLQILMDTFRRQEDDQLEDVPPFVMEELSSNLSVLVA